MSSPSAAQLEAWSVLLRAPGLGAGRLRAWLDEDGDIGAVLLRARRDSALDQATRAFLRAPPAERIAADVDWLNGPRRQLLTWDSPDYPPLLRRAPNPPAAIFVEGEPELLWRPQIAIVGSRNPTTGGLDNARDFAATFARAGLVVTSGLAEGIDAAAHGAALDAGQPTVAVLGTGPDQIYPRSQAPLARRIARHGALVSEYAPGTAARREHFPRRNRIIAGLSLGTLVIEAAQRSGALITARQASEAGRETFALPGSIHNPLARGCHRLIREGAALVESADEVLRALVPVAAELAAALRGRLGAERADAPATDPEYAQLIRALGHDPVGLDALVERTGLTVAALSSMLLLMELEGRVTAESGRYALRQS